MTTLSLTRVSSALAFLAIATAESQDSTSAPWTREVIKSARLNEERTILIATPTNYRTTNDSFPVLILLDADDRPQFTAALANIAFLTSRNAIPGLIVVGVTNGKDRTHDMTPPAIEGTAKQFATAGGADSFQDFINSEVVPYVRSKYRARRSTVLAGHSFGGLFAIHVAAKYPGTYAGIIAMSPSLWWNDSTVVGTYADAVAKNGTTQRLFATSGGLEQAIDRTTRHFVARLDSIKHATLAFSYLGLPEDTHGLTPLPSLVAGLRYTFEPVSLAKLPVASLGPQSDSASVTKALLESEEQYARGARALGLPEKLPENSVNQLGYNVLQGLKLPGLAVWVFSRNASNYPNSANVYDSWGDGLLAKGDTTAAIAKFKLAVEIGSRTHDPVVAGSRSKLEKLDRAPSTARKPD